MKYILITAAAIFVSLFVASCNTGDPSTWEGPNPLDQPKVEIKVPEATGRFGPHNAQGI